jgi:hypothetical protein
MLGNHDRRLLGRSCFHNRLENSPIFHRMCSVDCNCPGPILVPLINVLIGYARSRLPFNHPVASVPAYNAAVQRDLNGLMKYVSKQCIRFSGVSVAYLT